MPALLLIAEHDGRDMFARIGVTRALSRGIDTAVSGIKLARLCDETHPYRIANTGRNFP